LWSLSGEDPLGSSFGSPFEAVEARKQRKMIQAAQYFLHELDQRDALRCRHFLAGRSSEEEHIKTPLK
jgi:Holliday junction resolvase-like predicted endonuclease